MSPSSYTYGGVQISYPSGLKPACQDNFASENNNSDDAFEESSLCVYQNPTPPWVLSEVRLVGQNLTEVPPEISSLQGLHTLDLTHNHLTTLPSTMASATTLRELKLEGNNLSLQPVPPWFQHLSCCSRLNLQENPLGARFDITLGSSRALQRLKVVNLGDCSLSSIPSCFLNLRDLHTLHLSNRGEQETAMKEKNQRRATQANYRGSKNLLTLPSLDSLVGLARLEVVGCSLSHLPSLASLPSLRLLLASSNKLTTLPDLPTSLTALSVEKNNLLLLPSLSHLPKLAHIIASHNAISDISSLPASLETLDLFDNQLDQVGSYLAGLSLLLRVDIGANNTSSEEVKPLGSRYPKLQEDLRDWSGEVFVGGTKCSVGVSSRKERGEWEEESFISPWRRRREEETEMARRKSKGDSEGDDDPNIELYNAYWRQKGNCEDVEDVMNIEEERQIPRIGEEDQKKEEREEEKEEQDEQDQENVEEVSDEEWGNEAEAYSRRGGQGVAVRHNLEGMHLARWWGENQFCPSDRHPPTVNRELESQLRQWQENGRRGTPVPDIVGIIRTESRRNVAAPKQFDHA